MQTLDRFPPLLPRLGCALSLLAMMLPCLMPVVLVDVMRAALTRLHLSPPVAMLTVIAIFVRSLVNVPVRRIERGTVQPEVLFEAFSFVVVFPQFRRTPTYIFLVFFRDILISSQQRQHDQESTLQFVEGNEVVVRLRRHASQVLSPLL